ncbi:ABC-type transport auxiliary lipoprotein family protein [Sphingorhabdus sp. SMR4y]|uniref:ABC-type transport auxiliary lipoprotein family protein n=1 Tax=Sphingorhabdus sp. SMR4y TaxID=2584094 RepID=UPI000B5C5059|nr:ABC-type transport auxiliary lipoprotein family protein [Sphingorhabdus sp. SMR4y]ASK88334.1 ABC-type transport auxiliary lipoprotein component [Sphingorhabdus sp. SMR4y]
MMSTIWKAVGLLAMTAALSACVSFGGAEPPPSLLTLSPDQRLSAGAVRSGPQTGSLVVALPAAPQKLNTIRVPVQTTGTGIAYLKDAVWVDKPARLFQDLLSETIAANNNRLVLTATEAGGNAQTYITGELIDFGLDGPSLTVTVTYDAVKMVADKPVEKKRFQASEKVFAAEPNPVGEGLNRAANTVATEVAEWVG